MTETHYPVNGRITLYVYNHHAKPIRITSTALTDLEGVVRISNWRINNERTEITLTIEQSGGSNYQETFPCEIKETALPSPGRSFKWSEFWCCWQGPGKGSAFERTSTLVLNPEPQTLNPLKRRCRLCR